MDTSLHLNLWLIDPEATLLKNFNHSRWLRKDPLSGVTIDGRHADHFRIAAQVHMGALGVEWLGDAFFELAAGNQVLNVDFVLNCVGFSSRQAQIGVVGIAMH